MVNRTVEVEVEGLIVAVEETVEIEIVERNNKVLVVV